MIPGFVRNSAMIREDNYQQSKSEEEKQSDKEWEYDECVKRGCLPTGEPLDALFGQE